VRYLHLAADHGHARAQINMADRYANNEPMNHGEAARYYRLAADQGDIYAQ